MRRCLAPILQGRRRQVSGGTARYISLSEPEIRGEFAHICVTVFTPNVRPNAIFYETHRLTLQRKDGSWRVRVAEPLGIS